MREILIIIQDARGYLVNQADRGIRRLVGDVTHATAVPRCAGGGDT